MADTSAEIKELLRALVGIVIMTFPAEVIEVNEEAQTCEVLPVGAGASLQDVRLKGAVDNKPDGLVIFPKVGSSVLVSLIGNDDNEAFVCLFSEIEKIKCKVGDSLLEVGASEILLNGGELGGLIKIQELKTQLDKTNAVVNALKQVLTSWVPVPSDGGAALKAAAVSALSSLSVGEWSNIENEKVKH